MQCNEWIFTFGCGQEYSGHCVRISGSYGEARNKMVEKFGPDWAFQYSVDEWEKLSSNKNLPYKLETEIKIEGLN